MVSIPNGLPRPFSLGGFFCIHSMISAFQSRTGFPGHLAEDLFLRARVSNPVSIPNGLPRPFSQPRTGHDDYVISLFQSRTGFPGHLASGCAHATLYLNALFQSRTGFPGHLAKGRNNAERQSWGVSIPNGLPRPFSPGHA